MKKPKRILRPRYIRDKNIHFDDVWVEVELHAGIWRVAFIVEGAVTQAIPWFKITDKSKTARLFIQRAK